MITLKDGTAVEIGDILISDDGRMVEVQADNTGKLITGELNHSCKDIPLDENFKLYCRKYLVYNPVLVYRKWKKLNKLIILQGIPASGKSSIAKAWQKERPELRIIVCKDSLRMARGQYWIPSQEHYIATLELYAVKEALEDGYDVIIDGTNINPITICKYEALAKEYDIQSERWLLHASKADCIRRNFNEDRDHSVGTQVIDDFYRRYSSYCINHNIIAEPGTVTRFTAEGHENLSLLDLYRKCVYFRQ
jgi:predicted kinase